MSAQCYWLQETCGPNESFLDDAGSGEDVGTVLLQVPKTWSTGVGGFWPVSSVHCLVVMGRSCSNFLELAVVLYPRSSNSSSGAPTLKSSYPQSTTCALSFTLSSRFALTSNHGGR